MVSDDLDYDLAPKHGRTCLDEELAPRSFGGFPAGLMVYTGNRYPSGVANLIEDFFRGDAPTPVAFLGPFPCGSATCVGRPVLPRPRKSRAAEPFPAQTPAGRRPGNGRPGDSPKDWGCRGPRYLPGPARPGLPVGKGIAGLGTATVRRSPGNRRPSWSASARSCGLGLSCPHFVLAVAFSTISVISTPVQKPCPWAEPRWRRLHRWLLATTSMHEACLSPSSHGDLSSLFPEADENLCQAIGTRTEGRSCPQKATAWLHRSQGVLRPVALAR